ncbi:MAG: tetratricopeptide repeat protein [Acidihalobacter sp.]
MQRKDGLDAAQRDELVSVYQTLGEPDKAHEVLARYIRRHPDDRRIRVRLANLQVYDGEPEAGIATWQAIGRRFGENVEVRLALMRLNWQTYHMNRALELARSAAPEFDQAGDYDLSIAGELAWRSGDDALLKAAYERLWTRESATPIVPQRMALAAVQAGNVEAAALWAQRGWKRYHDGPLLLRIMPVAINAQRWDLVRRMLGAAGNRLNGHLEYWLIRAELATHDGHPRQSVAAYRHALAIAPGSVTARAGLLWTLVSLGDRAQLRHYLRRWAPDAVSDSGLWAAFAAAYSQIGETRRALAFYAREMRANPHDYLWAASYAQALDQAGYATDAWRMRRYALRGLRKQAQAELAGGHAGEATGSVVDLSRRLLGGRSAAPRFRRGSVWLPLSPLRICRRSLRCCVKTD